VEGVDTTALHASLAAAFDAWAAFRATAVAAVVLLSLRLLLELARQPRLAAVGAALLTSINDSLHAVPAFAIILTAYGIWGHVSFGSQVADWRTIGLSVDATIRLIMYDYDLLGTHAALRARWPRDDDNHNVPAHPPTHPRPRLCSMERGGCRLRVRVFWQLHVPGHQHGVLDVLGHCHRRLRAGTRGGARGARRVR